MEKLSLLRKKNEREPGEAKYVYRTAPLDYKSRTISKPAHTICASKAPAWFTKKAGKEAGKYRLFNTSELAALQTFPPNYEWPEGSIKALRQIGNAVPPLVAQLLMGGN